MTKSEVSSLAGQWRTKVENLGQQHTIWAPYLVLASIAAKIDIPEEAWHSRSDLNSFMCYKHIVPMLDHVAQKQSYIPDIMALWQPAVAGWIGSYCGYQKNVHQGLLSLSYLSPILDSLCVNMVDERACSYSVKLSHLLFEPVESAPSCAIQVATVLDVVNRYYWKRIPPMPVEVYVPRGQSHDLSRSALNDLNKSWGRWPVNIQRHDKGFYEVVVPKKDQEGKMIEVIAPFMVEEAEAVTREAAMNLIFGSKLLFDLCTQRWMLNNMGNMSQERYAADLRISTKALQRRLQKQGINWQDLKTECRYRFHYAALEMGLPEDYVLDKLRVTKGDQQRWLSEAAVRLNDNWGKRGMYA